MNLQYTHVQHRLFVVVDLLLVYFIVDCFCYLAILYEVQKQIYEHASKSNQLTTG